VNDVQTYFSSERYARVRVLPRLRKLRPTAVGPLWGDAKGAAILVVGRGDTRVKGSTWADSTTLS
jgi:hypothetical protein